MKEKHERLKFTGEARFSVDALYERNGVFSVSLVDLTRASSCLVDTAEYRIARECGEELVRIGFRDGRLLLRPRR